LAGAAVESYNEVMTRVYEELVDFIAGGSTADDVAAWSPSSQACERVADLIAAEKAGTLSDSDRIELERYMELEHLMRLAKARARRQAHE
jgi:hypothetical protein